QDWSAGIGVDAAFTTRSELYNADAVSRPGDYYNVTHGSGDMNPHGVPYGFFQPSVPLPGVPSGAYPLLLDTSLGEQRLRDTLLALKDGAYLDSELTESLIAQLVTYSPERHVFGYWRADFRWGAEGVIRCSLSVQGLPAIDWKLSLSSGNAFQVVSDLLLVLLVATYCTLTVQNLIASTREQRERSRATRLAVDAILRNSCHGGADGLSNDSDDRGPHQRTSIAGGKAMSFLVRSSSNLKGSPVNMSGASGDASAVTLGSVTTDSPTRSCCRHKTESRSGGSTRKPEKYGYETGVNTALQAGPTHGGPVCESTIQAGSADSAVQQGGTSPRFRMSQLEPKRATSSATAGAARRLSSGGSKITSSPGALLISSPSAISSGAISTKFHSGVLETNRSGREVLGQGSQQAAAALVPKKPLVVLTMDGEEE
ncbi:hypothetical protein Agub_g6762, partial [Astrephomene gubernaculifera]